MKYVRWAVEDCGQKDRASLYAIGLLERDESEVFGQHLRSCPSCGAEVKRSAELAVAFADALPLSSPPAALRDRVLAEVPLPDGVAALVRGPKLRWQPSGSEGVFIASLYTDSVRREKATMVRMSPGSFYPAHHHCGVEHCYVIQGDLVFSDHVLNAGDYEAALGGSDHSTVTTQSGCLLFLVHHTDDTVHTA